MKKTFSASLVLIFFALFIISCKNKNKDNTKFTKTVKDTALTIDTAFLDDKNYPYHNVTNTNDLKFVYRRTTDESIDNNVYLDSTFTKKYLALTEQQKELLIVPFLTRELKVDGKYARDYMTAYFVSKQQKIGNLQPIILSIGGDDYGSLTLILLNKQNKPVGGFNLDGGMQPGPEEIGDSLMKFDLKSYSKLRNREIITVRMEETDYKDTMRKDIKIDSNVFKTLIQTDGSFSTKQTVKTHFITRENRISVE